GRENVRRAHPAWIARARRECAGALAFFERGVPDLVRVEAIQHPRFLHAADAAADAFRAFAQHLETALPHSPPGACACGPEAREAADAHGLATWVTDPISFVPQPVWAREAAPSLYFLFYRAPAAFDRLPVVDYFVTPGAHESAIKLTHVIHHAGLGHHLQNWY